MRARDTSQTRYCLCCGGGVLGLFKMLVILALLGVPLLVITALPRLFDLAGSVPAVSSGVSGPVPTPAFRLTDPPPTAIRQRLAPVVEPPPPTLAAPAAPVQVATPPPTP